MTPFEAEVVQSIVVAVSLLTGLGMALRFSLKKREVELRRRELERGGGTPDVDALRREVAGLKGDQAQLESQLLELQERLDFTERLLAKGRPPQAG